MRETKTRDHVPMDLIDLFMKLLSFESITPDDAGSLAFIESYLPGFEVIHVNRGGVKNLFMYKRFGEGDHLLQGMSMWYLPVISGRAILSYR